MRFSICLVLVLSFANQLFASEQLVLAADEWCPFNCRADDHQRPGYMIELAQRIFSAHDINVTYINLPWPRAKAQVSDGQVQGLVAATRDDPDTRHLIFPEYAQGQMHNVFIGRSDARWQYQGLVSLRNIRLGAIKDYEYGQPLDNYLVTPNAPIHLVTGNRPLERLIRMLQSGRLDIIVEDYSVFTFTARSLDFTQYRLVGDIPGNLTRGDLFIAFTPDKKGRRYANILSEGMISLRQSGELLKIMAKYGLQDWHRVPIASDRTSPVN